MNRIAFTLVGLAVSATVFAAEDPFVPSISGEIPEGYFDKSRPLPNLPVMRSFNFFNGSDFSVNDPWFKDQTHFKPYNPGNAESGSAVGEALGLTVQNKKVRIAVIDSGFWYHSDMKTSSEATTFMETSYSERDEYGNVVGDTEYRYDWTYTDDAPDEADWSHYESGNPRDWCIVDHGLSVSSQISAIGNNYFGISGVGDFEVIPLRGGDCKGIAILQGIWVAMGEYSSEDKESIAYYGPEYKNKLPPRLENPVDIISISAGSDNFGFPCSREYNEVINRAKELGITIVAGAGNDGKNEKFFPAACEGVLSVGAVNRYGEVTSFSNYGDWVDVSAFGRHVPAATRREGDFGLTSGTSISTPIVAAIIGLGKQKYPQATPDVLMEAIKITTNPFKYGVQENCHTDHSTGCWWEANYCDDSNGYCSAGVVDAAKFIRYLDAYYAGDTPTANHPVDSKDRASKIAFYQHFSDQIDFCNLVEWNVPAAYNQYGSELYLYSIPTGSDDLVSNATFIKRVDEQRLILEDLSDGLEYAVQVCSPVNGCSSNEVVRLDVSSLIVPSICQ